MSRQPSHHPSRRRAAPPAGSGPVSAALVAAADETGMLVQRTSVRSSERPHPGAPYDGDALEITLEGATGCVSLLLERSDRPFTNAERALLGRIVDSIGHVTVAVEDEARPRVARAVSAAAAPDTVAEADYARTLEQCLFRLDEMTSVGTAERLVEVVRLCVAACGARSWWVARVDGDRVVTVARHDAFATEADVVPVHSSRLDALLAVPAITHVLEGGSYAGDVPPTSWGPYLAARGLTCCVAAGGYDDDARQWIVGLFDDRVRDLRSMRLLLSGAVQVALGVPAGRRAAKMGR